MLFRKNGVESVDDGFAVGPDTNIYVSVPDHMEDSSEFGSICALARAIQGSTDIIFTVFGNKSSPSASGKDRGFAVDGGTIRVPMDVYVSVFSRGDSVVWDFCHDVVLILPGPLGAVSKQDILVGDVIAKFIYSNIFIAYSTMEHAWCLGHGFYPDRTVGMFGSGFMDGFGNPGNTGLSNIIVMVAMPHHMPRCGPGPFARRVVTSIRIDQPRLIEPIRRSDASRYDGFENSGFVRVAFVLMLGILFVEVGPGGLDINERLNANHIFPVSLHFVVVFPGGHITYLVIVFGVMFLIKQDFSFSRGTGESVIRAILADSFTKVI